mmetsp:Transcript_9243/g.21390  ORF Transcript_9243/g.21390 Transcript_9243/m.21390 type:complete len:222 (+) Transcript_9243:78-743(+)
MIVLVGLVFDDVLERKANFGAGIAHERIGDDLTLDGEVYGLERTAQHAAQKVAVLEPLGRGRKLHKVFKRVVLESERAACPLLVPVADLGGDVEKHLEADTRDDLRGFAEAPAARDPRLGKELVDEPEANVVAHLLQLAVHLVHVLVVANEVGHEGAIGEREELGADLVELAIARLAESRVAVLHRGRRRCASRPPARAPLAPLARRCPPRWRSSNSTGSS